LAAISGGNAQFHPETHSAAWCSLVYPGNEVKIIAHASSKLNNLGNILSRWNRSERGEELERMKVPSIQAHANGGTSPGSGVSFVPANYLR
jgi:hypothetical protein